jgi:hypothetical protein
VRARDIFRFGTAMIFTPYIAALCARRELSTKSWIL